jgi:hypothetical protein
MQPISWKDRHAAPYCGVLLRAEDRINHLERQLRRELNP